MKIVEYRPKLSAEWVRLSNFCRSTPLTSAEHQECESLWPLGDFRCRRLGMLKNRTACIGQLNAYPYGPVNHAMVAIYVSDWARRRGQGQEMLAHLESEAVAAGLEGLVATLDVDNELLPVWWTRN